MVCLFCILCYMLQIQFGYLDNLDPKGVIIWIAAFIKGKTKSLLPVNRDTVEVLVC